MVLLPGNLQAVRLDTCAPRVKKDENHDRSELGKRPSYRLGLVAAGEEIEVTREDRVVARLVPPAESARRIAWPDFSARARKIVGRPKGPPTSQLIVAERGERI